MNDKTDLISYKGFLNNESLYFIGIFKFPIYVNNNSAQAGTNITSGGNFDIDDRMYRVINGIYADFK